MAHLQPDILLLVSSFLSQRDQLECMTVCRRWYDTVYQHSLFHDMFIFSDEQLYKVLNKIKRNHLMGKKVVRLTLQMDFWEEYNAQIITSMFPNLRHFAVITTQYYTKENEIITPLQSHPWCKHIETIVDNFSDLNAKTILYSGLCKNLTYIAMSGRQKADPVCDFIEKLVNAPALKTLCLIHYTMTFNDIELIHENAPLLNTLLLKSITCSDTSFAPDIKPANLVKCFQLIKTSFYPSSFNIHLSYISQKYTHLEELTLDLYQLNPDYVNDEWVLEDYMVTVKKPRERMRSYMKILAPRLKSLSIFLQAFSDYSGIVDFDFNILDESGCQIKKMTLGDGLKAKMVKELAKTNQVEYIQSLTINEIYTQEFYFCITSSLKCLSTFTALTELTLGYRCSVNLASRPELCLDEIIGALGECQLETLRLFYVELGFEESSKHDTYPSLKNLALFNSEFQDGADVVISQLFPNLKRFTLNNCFEDRVTLMLPQSNLLNLEISRAYENGQLHAVVITLDNGEQRVYSSSKTPVLAGEFVDENEENTFTSRSFSSKPCPQYTGIPFFTVVCKSVYSVSLRNSDS